MEERKMFNNNARILRKSLLLISSLILTFCTGYLLGTFQSPAKYYMKPIGSDGAKYLGTINGRRIYVDSLSFPKYPKQKDFILLMNNYPVYWESDTNSDGQIDSIAHFEKGLLMYHSEDTNSDGVLNRRRVEYYHGDRLQDKHIPHDKYLVDANSDGHFNVRVINPHMGADAQVEILLGDGKWVKREKQDSSYGFYNDVGEFIPIYWNKGNWKILENKE